MTGGQQEEEPTPRWDFFISYTGVDRGWAEWVAWQLEAAGLRVLIQAWDFIPGSNWAVRMQQGVSQADRTIALLSEAYLTSIYGQAEWQAAQAADPLGFASRLVPIRITDCPRPGLLGQIVSFDLFDVPAATAAARLLEQVRILRAGRAKPPAAPVFPGLADTPGSTTVLTSPPRTPGRRQPVPPPAPGPLVRGTPVRRAVLHHGSQLSRALGAPGIRAVMWSPNDRLLAAGSDDSTVTVWDVANPATPARRATLTDHRHGSVKAVGWSPDGHLLATGCADSTVQLWEMTDPASPARRAALTDHRDWVEALAWSPDRHVLATGNRDGTVTFWDVANPLTPTRRTTLTDHRSPVRAVAWSPDGHLLATGNRDGTVTVWDVVSPLTPARRATLTDHRGPVRAVAWSPDSRLLASGSADSTVQLWGMADPASPARRATLTGHRGWVEAVAWSPDGHLLAAGSVDSTVTLWEVTSIAAPTRRATLTDHRGPVEAVAWSPDSHLLATGGADWTVIVWELPDAR
ncbi:TIR domain-containing protein [Frankia sp. CiP1_Cm_nod2]|uniref:TIR domain-containing protein n=1 Tax=Frankia sp. CiP1_Cm_nod2 TaxID=2897161 RepID=UPI0020243273